MVRTLVLDGLSKAANSLGFALKQTEKQHQKTRSFFLGVLQLHEWILHDGFHSIQ